MPTALSPPLLERLRHVVGAAGCIDDAQGLEPYLTDYRKLFRGATPLVLQPASTQEVSQIVQLCHEQRIGVVPVGGNTSYCGGATPSADGSQLVVSLARLRRVRQIDAANYTLTAEAGCTLAEVHAAAAAADRLFPLSLGSEGTCQLGGNLSTNAGGTAVLRYGMARDLVLGLEVVLPNGSVLNELSGLRKNNTGYDLRDLFIGAEGTLGIITAATCKLFPRAVTAVTALIAVRNPEAAVELLGRLRQASGDCLTTFELLPRIALELVLQHVAGVRDPLEARHPWYVLAEITTSRADPALLDDVQGALAAAQEQGSVLDAALAQNEAQRAMFWRIRESMPEAERRTGASIKHDVSVSISAIPELIREGSALLLRIEPRGRVVVFGHLGDGSLHFNLAEPAAANGTDEDRAAFLSLAPRINRAMHDLVTRHGGSISAEHGIGQLKRAELERYKSPAAMEVMRAIKRALDPEGIMNPGKVLLQPS